MASKMDTVKIFKELYKKYGPQFWWPVYNNISKNNEKIFEICVGAILTQNTSWKNVEKTLVCLLKENLISPQTIVKCPKLKLERCLRSSGYYKQKAKKLKIFSKWILDKYKGDWKLFFKQPLQDSRQELFNLWGIGPETADSILLYAGHKQIFVIDAYTKRLCAKYGVAFKTYQEYQNFFEDNLNGKLKNWSREKLYNEYHALVVRWGKEKGKSVYFVAF